MAYFVNEECIDCGACIEACPSGAISQGDGKAVVDPDACIDCGVCEGECPTEAIKPE